MRASSHKLTKLIAVRIGQILPAPLTVRTEGEALQILDGGNVVGGSQASMILSDGDSRSMRERVPTAVRAVLSALQDDVSAYLQTPWPSPDNVQMFLPGARTDGDKILLWYGDENDQSHIVMEPINVGDLDLPSVGQD